MLALALLLGTLGTICVVLRHPNQEWREGRRLPAGCGWLGLVLIAASFWAAWQAMRPVASVFVIATLLMLTFGLIPVIGPVWRARRMHRQDDHTHG